MAIFEISVHSELREEAQPLVDALQYVADFIEGLYGYKMGCQDTMNTNEYASLWGSNHLAGHVSKERHRYGFQFSHDNDVELKSSCMENPSSLISHNFDLLN